ncbi:hypothetical protein BU15DRAFT_80288 [Melanogaster broomeanus]|nr:hypothetical protein BU15DRAFT_80288 [Melanogaster broomeanus]
MTSKWANWDPPIPVEVGAYGKIDRDTGALIVEGNIYDPEFQEELDKVNGKLKMAESSPRGRRNRGRLHHRIIRCQDEGLQFGAGSGTVAIREGQRDALLVMHNPRLELQDKYLVTSVHVCPAFYMYLSNKSGENISLALVAQVPIAAAVGATAGGNVGFEWRTDTQDEFASERVRQKWDISLHPAVRAETSYRILKRLFREKAKPEPEGDDRWCDVSEPWDPLDEDGEEDEVDLNAVDEVEDFE